MRNLFLYIGLLCPFLTNAQSSSINHSIWNHSKENYIFLVYTDNEVYRITDYIKANYPDGGITLSSYRYGFYNSCEVPHIDSLKTSGAYYFEVSDIEINDRGEIVKPIRCLELTFSKEKGEDYINIYRSSQQQFSTYRKLEELPKNLEDFLKKERPEVYKVYCEIRKE